MKRGRLATPPWFLAAHLPCSPSLLTVALEGLGPGDAWARIVSGGLSFGRVVTTARAAPSPVTVLARGVVRGRSFERAGAGGVAPIIEISHVSAELPGLQSGLLAALERQPRLGELPEHQRALARRLLDAGLIDLVAI